MRTNEITLQKDFRGVGFIKSRKSESRVMDMAAEMIERAERMHLTITNIIVDRSSGMDIDRKKIDELAAAMEKESVNAVMVRSLTEISNNRDDIKVFLDIADKCRVSVFTMNEDE